MENTHRRTGKAHEGFHPGLLCYFRSQTLLEKAHGVPFIGRHQGRNKEFSFFSFEFVHHFLEGGEGFGEVFCWGLVRARNLDGGEASS